MIKSLLFVIGLAIAIVAFTAWQEKPTYYRFVYQLQSFAKANVESETIASWGYGTLLTSSDEFSIGCDGLPIKACEIIVPGSSVVDDGSGNKRLLSLESGDPISVNNVTIKAAANADQGTYYVCGGTNIVSKRNRR